MRPAALQYPALAGKDLLWAFPEASAVITKPPNRGHVANWFGSMNVRERRTFWACTIIAGCGGFVRGGLPGAARWRYSRSALTFRDQRVPDCALVPFSDA